MKKLTDEEVDARIVGRNILRLDPYINSDYKIKWKCLIDDHIWEAAPDAILNAKHGCPKCANKIPITNESIDIKIKNRNIIRLENVKTALTKIKWKCLIDGYEWENCPNEIINKKSGCPKCAKKIPPTNQEIDEIIKNRNIIRLEDVKCTKIKTKWKCLIDGHEWKTTATYILYQNGKCPKCKQSKGEEIIYSVLNELKIDYIKEKTFPTCRYKSLLRFDFYIEGTNQLIEYQGIQHFKQVSFGGKGKQIEDEIRFKETLVKDKIKRDWALKNGYDLTYFTYKDSKEEIIDKLKFLLLFK